MKKLVTVFIAFTLSISIAQAFGPKHSYSASSLEMFTSRVTSQQVTDYLRNRGYILLTSPVSSDEGFTWSCYTEKEGIRYETTVFTDGLNIIGYEDVMI